MAETAQLELLTAAQIAQHAPLQQAENGIFYAAWGATQIAPGELLRVIHAVPSTAAAALRGRAYYFVPLAIGQEEETVVAPDFTVELSDRATCHRNVHFASAEATFLSTRLMQDRFALAFEFFINVGHHFVDAVGVPQQFMDLAWSQAKADTRGETSQDAWENRKRALEQGGGRMNREDERAKTAYFEAAFSDALAIYMLSLNIDFDYADLREREYPLLAAPALAERLRLVNSLFPANAGYEFEVRYRRRG